MRSLAPHPRLARPARCLAGALIATALATAPASAGWPTYGTNLGPTLYGFFGARVFPNADGGGTVGYFARYGGTQTYPLILFARVDGTGILVAGSGPNDPYGGDLSSTGTGGIYLGANFGGPTVVTRWPATPGWPT